MPTAKKIAVVGLGNIGKAIARNLVKGNRPIIISSRKLSDAQELAQQLGGLATAVETHEAIKQADIIVLSVWFNVLQEFLTEHAEELKGKIIIDPSNPIAFDENGNFKRIIGEKETAGQLNAQLLLNGAKLAKVFSTFAAAVLTGTAFTTPDYVVQFYATDDTDIDADVEQLILDSGFDPVKVGGLDQSIRIEALGDLSGKIFTAAEVKDKVQINKK